MLAFLTGQWELIVILVIALLLFGRRLPEVMRAMGRGIHQFKKGLTEVEDDINSAAESDEEAARKLAEEGSDSEPSSPAG